MPQYRESPAELGSGTPDLGVDASDLLPVLGRQDDGLARGTGQILRFGRVEHGPSLAISLRARIAADANRLASRANSRRPHPGSESLGGLGYAAAMLRPLFLGFVTLGLVGCADDSKRSNAGGDSSRPRRVITADWLNQSLSVLDYDKLVAGATTRAEALIETIDVSSYDGPGPIEIATTPDGATAVVTHGPGFFFGFVADVFNVGTQLPDGGLEPLETTGTALVIDLDTFSIVETKPPAVPMGVAVTPDGKRAITADHRGDTISVIDLEQRRLIESVTVGGSPEEVSINEDGTWGCVTTDSNGSIRFFDPRNPSTTLTAPLSIQNDPGLSAWVPGANRLVVAKSLPLQGGPVGFSVVDVSNPTAASVLEAQPLPGVPYGADPIPGTTHVLVTSGCELYEVDAAPSPAAIVRTIQLPCTAPSLPMSTAIDREGTHAFVGLLGDNSLMVVDLASGTARRLPWLGQTGPTDVAIAM